MKSKVHKISINSVDAYLKEMSPIGNGDEKIEQEEEIKEMNKKTPKSFSENDSRVLAWKEACENRKFEIEMYWKRATYFWAFIVSIYTAFFVVLTADIEKENTILKRYVGLQEGALFLLAFLGFVFCFAFLLQNIGSKEWQKNWETHVDLLEDRVVGSLYKTFLQDEKKNFSVTAINKTLCWILAIASLAILAYSSWLFVNSGFFPILDWKCAIPIAIIVIGVLLFVFKSNLKFLKGNATNEEENSSKKETSENICFVERKYENIKSLQ